MQTQQTTPPAGWYPDPNGEQRWWDGTQWGAAAQTPGVVEQKRTNRKGLLLAGSLAVAFIAVAAAISAAGSGNAKHPAAPVRALDATTTTTAVAVAPITTVASVPLTTALLPPITEAPVTTTTAKKFSKEDDVTATSIYPGAAGEATLSVTIFNHSSKRSDYVLVYSIVSADGHQEYGVPTVKIYGVAPGETTTQDFTLKFLVPDGARYTQPSVIRSATP